MADRLYRDLEIALSSFSAPCNDDYNEEDEESEEEYDGEEVNGVEIEGKSEELACPFCSEDFDVLGLCCHIDADHRMEVKPGIIRRFSPFSGLLHLPCLCCEGSGKHGFTCDYSSREYIEDRSTRSRSSIYLLRKELQDKHLRAVKESPTVGSSSNAAADSMLLSFVNSPQPAYRPQITEAATPSEASLSGKSSYDDSVEKFPLSLSTDRNIEMARRSEFVQGLLLSTILDDL
ncbi:protein DEHYDRATION-INDUCED 19 homolog 7-like isoform X2 [Salvia splendens]|uniref:protein DEHYDRATION-INDUCED 19 homolog 7-like isoform X2 n=1 Tax=Salvia splendens TaxID=180675 RepID=UPI001C25EB30|nr:protein DEHYDRATION-INDUCED 19 homolog 7-like isoform X2 [Salvia splendens]